MCSAVLPNVCKDSLTSTRSTSRVNSGETHAAAVDDAPVAPVAPLYAGSTSRVRSSTRTHTAAVDAPVAPLRADSTSRVRSTRTHAAAAGFSWGL